MRKKKIASLLDQKVKCIITDKKGTTIKGIQIGDVILFVDSFLMEENWNPDNTTKHVHSNKYIIISKTDNSLYTDLYCKEGCWIKGKGIDYFKNQ